MINDNLNLDSLFDDSVIAQTDTDNTVKTTTSTEKVETGTDATSIDKDKATVNEIFDLSPNPKPVTVSPAEHPFVTFIEDFESIDAPEKLPDLTNPENIYEFIKAEREAYFNNGINSLKDDIGEIGIKFLQFVKNGGNKEDFINTIVTKPQVSKMPYSTTEDKIEILKTIYKTEGMADSEIEALVKHHTTADTLDTVVADKRTKAIDKELAEADKLANAAKESKKKLLIDRDNYKQAITSKLNNLNTLFDIPLPANKAKLVDFVSKYEFVDTKNNTEYTKFDVELQKALQDENKKLFIAYLLSENFDLGFVKKAVKTEFIDKSIKSKDNSVKPSTANTGKSSAMGLLELADMF